jgi:hypothetical protein
MSRVRFEPSTSRMLHQHARSASTASTASTGYLNVNPSAKRLNCTARAELLMLLALDATAGSCN